MRAQKLQQSGKGQDHSRNQRPLQKKAQDFSAPFPGILTVLDLLVNEALTLVSGILLVVVFVFTVRRKNTVRISEFNYCHSFFCLIPLVVLSCAEAVSRHGIVHAILSEHIVWKILMMNRIRIILRFQTERTASAVSRMLFSPS